MKRFISTTVLAVCLALNISHASNTPLSDGVQLTHLKITRNQTLPEELSGLTSLTSLSIQNNAPVTSDDVNRLTNLTKLELLHAPSVKLSELNPLTQLKELGLSGERQDTGCCITVFPNLQKLYFSYCDDNLLMTHYESDFDACILVGRHLGLIGNSLPFLLSIEQQTSPEVCMKGLECTNNVSTLCVMKHALERKLEQNADAIEDDHVEFCVKARPVLENTVENINFLLELAGKNLEIFVDRFHPKKGVYPAPITKLFEEFTGDNK